MQPYCTCQRKDAGDRKEDARDRKEELCRFIAKERMTRSKPTEKVVHFWEFPTLWMSTQVMGSVRLDWKKLRSYDASGLL